ncbi:uncharacterized protein LOC131543775 [Onychostoma macrolepis]|uniref:uncharacterized protein LOC131543775 n=1 Tax=Onychostoma macrolepis TaxID=369639 RepID=UPI00272D1438|nr:uncharacterized protein LOC131543775 [Onychostoma macrolepis]XP_058637523.1 uncharacterized protein LOC131543775 [Onychostoma macrolepis]
MGSSSRALSRVGFSPRALSSVSSSSRARSSRAPSSARSSRTRPAYACGWAERQGDFMQEFVDYSQLATCDDLTLMEGFWCRLDDDIHLVMPRADPCWSLKNYIDFALWITCGRHSAVSPLSVPPVVPQLSSELSATAVSSPPPSVAPPSSPLPSMAHSSPPFAVKSSPPPSAAYSSPPSTAHVPLGILVEYEGMSWAPASKLAPVSAPAPEPVPPVPTPTEPALAGPRAKAAPPWPPEPLSRHGPQNSLICPEGPPYPSPAPASRVPAPPPQWNCYGARRTFWGRYVTCMFCLVLSLFSVSLFPCDLVFVSFLIVILFTCV